MKRVIIEGFTYHVTSRTNNKIIAFEDEFNQKVMLDILEAAKKKYNFLLHNFCIMPTHFHLLITPADGTNLSKIMHRIKVHSSKCWNYFNNSSGHLWGERFFSRPINGELDYFTVNEYIEQNPVKAGFVKNPEDWNASGAYHRANKLFQLLAAA